MVVPRLRAIREWEYHDAGKVRASRNASTARDSEPEPKPDRRRGTTRTTTRFAPWRSCPKIGCRDHGANLRELSAWRHSVRVLSQASTAQALHRHEVGSRRVPKSVCRSPARASPIGTLLVEVTMMTSSPGTNRNVTQMTSTDNVRTRIRRDALRWSSSEAQWRSSWEMLRRPPLWESAAHAPYPSVSIRIDPHRRAVNALCGR